MLFLTAQIAVIATALVAGVFLAFSDFIMRSLAAAQPAAGAEAMQEVNRKVYRSIFLSLFFAMTAGSVLMIGAGVMIISPAAPWLIVGGAAYLIGVFGVTVFGNVPMNKRLDAMAPGDAATKTYWRDYAVRWTRLNHIRSVSASLAAIAFLIAAQQA